MEVHNSIAEPWRVTLVDTGDNTGTGGRLRRVAQIPDARRRSLLHDLRRRRRGCGHHASPSQFHKEHGKLVTLTSVQPVATLRRPGLKDTQIYSFQEKPQDEGGWINGGFFVLSAGCPSSAVTDEAQMFEREPIEIARRAGRSACVLSITASGRRWIRCGTNSSLRNLWSKEKGALEDLVAKHQRIASNGC